MNSNNGVINVTKFFFPNDQVRLRDITDLCDDPEKLRNFLLKSGLLGDDSGVCNSRSSLVKVMFLLLETVIIISGSAQNKAAERRSR